MKKFLTLTLITGFFTHNALSMDSATVKAPIYVATLPGGQVIDFKSWEIEERQGILLKISPENLQVRTRTNIEVTQEKIRKEYSILTLNLDEQIQLKKALISFAAALESDNDETSFDLDFLTPLPQKVQNALIAGKLITPEPVTITKYEAAPTLTLTQKIINVPTLTVGAVCALTAWYAAKHTGSSH